MGRMYSFRTHELHHEMKAQLLQQMRASCPDLMIGCVLSASEAYVARRDGVGVSVSVSIRVSSLYHAGRSSSSWHICQPLFMIPLLMPLRPAFPGEPWEEICSTTDSADYQPLPVGQWHCDPVLRLRRLQLVKVQPGKRLSRIISNRARTRETLRLMPGATRELTSTNRKMAMATLGAVSRIA